MKLCAEIVGLQKFPTYLLLDIATLVTESGQPNLPLKNFPFQAIIGALPPKLTPLELDYLLGKSPLRLVSDRILVEKGIWLETLECGHEVTTFVNCAWDEGAHLILSEPSAKRRRCQKCKALSLAEVGVERGTRLTGRNSTVDASSEPRPASERVSPAINSTVAGGRLASCPQSGTSANPLPSPIKKKPVQPVNPESPKKGAA